MVGLYTVAPPTYQAGAMGSRLQNHQCGRVVQQCRFLPTRLVQWDLDYEIISMVGLYIDAPPTYQTGAMGSRLQNLQHSRVVHCCTHLPTRLVQCVSDYKIISAVGLYTVALPMEQAGTMGLRLQNHQQGRVVH